MVPSPFGNDKLFLSNLKSDSELLFILYNGSIICHMRDSNTSVSVDDVVAVKRTLEDLKSTVRRWNISHKDYETTINPYKLEVLVIREMLEKCQI